MYSFHNNGRQVLLLGSADWMDRNFFRRIETCFPVRRKSHINRINEDLQLYLDDTLGAWEMLPDGRYERLRPGPDRPPLSAQLELLTRYGAQI